MHEYIWAHSQNFQENPEACFDLGAREEKASVAFFDGEREVFFNTVKSIKMVKTEKSLNLIYISAKNKIFELDGTSLGKWIGIMPTDFEGF